MLEAKEKCEDFNKGETEKSKTQTQGGDGGDRSSPKPGKDSFQMHTHTSWGEITSQVEVFRGTNHPQTMRTEGDSEISFKDTE